MPWRELMGAQHPQPLRVGGFNLQDRSGENLSETNEDNVEAGTWSCAIS